MKNIIINQNQAATSPEQTETRLSLTPCFSKVPRPPTGLPQRFQPFPASYQVHSVHTVHSPCPPKRLGQGESRNTRHIFAPIFLPAPSPLRSLRSFAAKSPILTVINAN